MKIYLHDYFGANILDANIATDVLRLIVDFSKQGDVEVSFDKINITVLHPMHIFIGMLFAPENRENILRVRFVDMRLDTSNLVNKVANNAIEHYKVPDSIVQQLIARRADDVAKANMKSNE